MYTVLGYDDMCYHFRREFDSFTDAVNWWRKVKSSTTAFLMRETPSTCLFVK